MSSTKHLIEPESFKTVQIYMEDMIGFYRVSVLGAKQGGNQKIIDKYQRFLEDYSDMYDSFLRHYAPRKRQRKKITGKENEVFMTDDVYRIKGDQVLIRPAMHNPFMAKRYFCKRHPLSDICVTERGTGKIVELKACDHRPHYMTQSDDLFDTSLYTLKNLRLEKKRGCATCESGRRAEEASGVSYDKFLA